MWFLLRAYFFLWCSSRLCSQSSTSPLTTLISSLSLSHHLYADDDTLWYSTFFSFHPYNFDSSVAYLQTALKHISSWMSANLLTLNSSETEFLIIGLKQQLSKIDNCSLNTTHYACNLGFIFDENLTFSDQISSLSKSCYSHICALCCIRPYLDSKTASGAVPSLLLLSILNLTTVTLYYNLPKSQQIQNCLAHTDVKAPKSSHVTPILRSLVSALAYSPTKFLQPANLTTCTILSLFSLQVALAPRLLSL